MNEPIKNECRCHSVACGCGKAPAEGCSCGQACDCGQSCGCGPSCSCPAESGRNELSAAEMSAASAAGRIRIR